MNLNEQQEGLVAAVLRNEMNSSTVCTTLSEISPDAYENKSFRGMLFALDATNLMDAKGWATVFRNALVERTSWLKDGALDPGAFTEIGHHHETFGRGMQGMALVIDLFEIADNHPNNARSFTRRTIREFFNGIAPIDDLALFHVRRYFDNQRALEQEDFRLLLHINRETRGLDNSLAFGRFLTKTLWRFLTNDNVPADSLERLIAEFEAANDICEADRQCLRWLVDQGVELPDSLLGHIDISLHQLAGRYH